MSSTGTPNPAVTLSKYLGRTLRIHTTDKRIFVGQMRCTDRECNVILVLTQEYRPPSAAVIKAAAEQSGSNPQVPFLNRYVGLVVVPGKHITKIELEEWVGP